MLSALTPRCAPPLHYATSAAIVRMARTMARPMSTHAACNWAGAPFCAAILRRAGLGSRSMDSNPSSTDRNHSEVGLIAGGAALAVRGKLAGPAAPAGLGRPWRPPAGEPGGAANRRSCPAPCGGPCHTTGGRAGAGLGHRGDGAVGARSVALGRTRRRVAEDTLALRLTDAGPAGLGRRRHRVLPGGAGAPGRRIAEGATGQGAPLRRAQRHGSGGEPAGAGAPGTGRTGGGPPHSAGTGGPGGTGAPGRGGPSGRGGTAPPLGDEPAHGIAGVRTVESSRSHGDNDLLFSGP